MEFLTTDIPAPKITPRPEDTAAIAKLNETLDGSKLTEREQTFLVDVKARILDGKRLTKKQDEWLSRILNKALRQKALNTMAGGY